jgi:hypothetical protein
VIAALRGEGFIAAGPRSPTPGAPYAYVTTLGFLAEFGFGSLRDLPDIEKLEDAGLLGRTSGDPLDGAALSSELRGVLGLTGDEDEPEENAASIVFSMRALVVHGECNSFWGLRYGHPHGRTDCREPDDRRIPSRAAERPSLNTLCI